MSEMIPYPGDILNALFAPMFQDTRTLPNTHPIRVDVKTTDTADIITAQVPGVSKDEISIEFADDILTLKVEGKSETEDNDQNFTHREIRKFSDKRQIRFENIDKDNITAHLEDGILTITLPKLPEPEPKSVGIEIQ